ncbi:ABC transporter substrate-binding protein [Halostagnicola sp. A56]|uniref:ABC transporter substrate-binding protein n=1 Tax=Halostagnicola sp. A56 TaxID=1495067 RepID=UPI0009E60C46|nr:ABC transporter substrate-binding protein [Halostagnicola sp. A56]
MRYGSRRRFVEAAAFASVSALAGCIGGAFNESEYERAIGMPSPQSGPLATNGERALQAAEIAIGDFADDASEEVMLEKQDGEGDPEAAITVTRDLLDNGVPAVTGTFSSDVSTALSNHAESEEVPFMTAISVAAEVVESGNEYTFRMTGNLEQKMTGMVEFLNQQDVSGISVIAADYSMGRSAVDFLDQQASNYDMELVSDAVVPMSTNDFVPELQSINTDGIDAIFCPFPGGNGPTLVQQMREQNMFEEVDIVIGHDSYGTEAFREALGEDIVDIYNWGVDLRNERAQQASEQMQDERRVLFSVASA